MGNYSYFCLFMFCDSYMGILWSNDYYNDNHQDKLILILITITITILIMIILILILTMIQMMMMILKIRDIVIIVNSLGESARS